MNYLILILVLFIAYLVWPLELDETITACVFMWIVGVLASMSPLRNRSIM